MRGLYNFALAICILVAGSVTETSAAPKLRDLLCKKNLFRAAVVVGLGAALTPTFNYTQGGKAFSPEGADKNAIAVVAMEIVAHRVAPQSKFSAEIKKKFYFDAKMAGSSGTDRDEATVELSWQNAHFTVTNPSQTNFEGDVTKAGPNWKVKQIGTDLYEISTPFTTNQLELHITNGVISGNFARKAGIDWQITGSYKETGDVQMEIDGPLTMGIEVVGKIFR